MTSAEDSTVLGAGSVAFSLSPSVAGFKKESNPDSEPLDDFDDLKKVIKMECNHNIHVIHTLLGK